MSVCVRVPATSANLGPGFDALGLAVGLYDEVIAETAAADEVVVTGAQLSPWAAERLAVPPASSPVPTGAKNLFLRAAHVAYPDAHFRLQLKLGIPVGRGLGSSAAAIVGGLLVGCILAGRSIDPTELLPEATKLEGHPDNVAPALFGGLCAACQAGDRVWAIRLDPPSLWAAAAVPDRPLPTAQARRALPERVAFEDAVANIQRTALLVAACAAGRWEALAEATHDRLHQPYRAPLVPGLAAALDAAREAGAVGAFLSGAGPTALALASSQEKARDAGLAMCTAFSRAGVAATPRILTLEAQGARVVPA